MFGMASYVLQLLCLISSQMKQPLLRLILLTDSFINCLYNLRILLNQAKKDQDEVPGCLSSPPQIVSVGR